MRGYSQNIHDNVFQKVSGWNNNVVKKELFEGEQTVATSYLWTREDRHIMDYRIDLLEEIDYEIYAKWKAERDWCRELKVREFNNNGWGAGGSRSDFYYHWHKEKFGESAGGWENLPRSSGWGIQKMDGTL